MSKVIIIRGNSGSGKTTTARRIQETLQPHYAQDDSAGVMLVSQDAIRRDMLRVKDQAENPSIQLIKDIATYGNSIGYTVILEGIFASKKYGKMLGEVMDLFDEVYVYYFDISFEETLRRHSTKPNSQEFGEDQMREWYVAKGALGVPAERIFTDEWSQGKIVKTILEDVQ